MEHVRQEQIAAYWNGSLPAAELLRLDEHIEQCGPCRDLLLQAAPALAPHLQDADPHLDFSTLEAWVNSSLSVDRSQQVETHLGQCASCHDDAEDLRQFRRRMRHSAPARRWIKPAAIAASLLLAALAVWRFRPEPSPSLSISLHDNGRIIGIDANGRLAGLDSGNPQDAALLAQLLRGDPTPVHLPPGLSSSPTAFLGEESPQPRFTLTSPLSIVTLQDKPVFTWNPLPGAATYRVLVTDEQFQPVAESDLLRRPAWQPASPLPRGKLLLWQVVATLASESVRSPLPPQPEARFFIAAAGMADRIAAAKTRTPPSHLLLALLYAQAGLRAECEQEILLLQAENKASPLLDAWLAAVRRTAR
ncbi:MAG: zf-HC2 domain-containing protein [Bryobacterales bacterium]|nr:zf-HC2 domain-containing protein [Bryobacterales bacterium]